MAELPISGSPGTPGADRIQKAGQAPAAKPTTRTDESGKSGESRPAFEALLERLEEKARALDEETRRVEGPDDLAGAVKGAKSSLEDALSIGEELLERFRQSQQQQPPNPTEEA